MNELLHARGRCYRCDRARRRRRRAWIERNGPWLAIAAIVALMALGEALTHAVGP